MVLVETLREHFLALGVEIEDNAFLGKCLDLCDLYDVSEEILVEIWLAFVIEKEMGLEPTVDSLVEVERCVLKKDNKNTPDVQVMQADSSTYDTGTPRVNQDYADDENILGIYGIKGPAASNIKRSRSPDSFGETVARKNKMRALHTPLSPASYSNKTDAPRRSIDQPSGKILYKIGKDVDNWKSTSQWLVPVSKTNDPHVPAQAMYMFEILRKKASNYQRVCREFGARLCSTWCKSEANTPPIISNVGLQSQSTFRTFGRVACEMNGRLNSNAIMLEGCKRIRRSLVALDLTNVSDYSIFPGQILAVEGTNPTGDSIVVQTIFTSGYTEPSPAPKIDENLQIYIASGPFTDGESLSYQPLMKLMEQVSEMQPHVLILVGPFVPINNPNIQDATISDTFQELFEQIIKQVMQYVKGKCTRVVLIPSCRDAHHDPVYPTPEFFLPKAMLSPNLILVPDPCMLDIAGLTVGVTSVDIIRHLSSEEVNLNRTGRNRLVGLSNHILSQGCFYPLYPPSKEINIDTALWEKYAFMYQQPHILLLPSDMRHFCKWTHDCLVINPERVNKNTYARMIVRPSPDGSWTEKQIDCEILKI